MARAVANADVRALVDIEKSLSPALLHRVVPPEGVDKEGFHNALLVHLRRFDGIHQVGIVHINHRRLLGHGVALAVHHVY